MTYDGALLGVTDATDAEQIGRGDFQALIRAAVQRRLGAPADRIERRQQVALASNGAAYELMARLRGHPELLGASETLWLAADDDIDTWFKTRGGEEFTGRISERQMAWMNELAERGDAELRFNRTFFTSGDSREPEQAGNSGAAMGGAFNLGTVEALLGLAQAGNPALYAGRSFVQGAGNTEVYRMKNRNYSLFGQVDYELTELGRELLVPVKGLAEWAMANMGRVNEARRRFDGELAA